MLDYFRRLLIAVIMGLCVSLLFLGSKHTEAGMVEMKGQVQKDIIIKDDYLFNVAFF